MQLKLRYRSFHPIASISRPKHVHGQLLSVLCNKMCTNSVGQWLDVVLLPAKSDRHSTYMACNYWTCIFFHSKSCPLPLYFTAQTLEGKLDHKDDWSVIQVCIFMYNNNLCFCSQPQVQPS